MNVNFIREFCIAPQGINEGEMTIIFDSISTIYIILLIFISILALSGFLMNQPINERINTEFISIQFNEKNKTSGKVIFGDNINHFSNKKKKFEFNLNVASLFITI